MGSKGQKYLAFFNMLFIRADFCRPLRFINTAILFIFLSFWHIVHIVVALLFCPDILMIIYEEYENSNIKKCSFLLQDILLANYFGLNTYSTD